MIAKFSSHHCVVTTFAFPCHVVTLGLDTEPWDNQGPLPAPRKELYLKRISAKVRRQGLIGASRELTGDKEGQG